MDLTPTDEQKALREVAADFLSDAHPVHRMCELAERSEGWNSATWGPIADMGWLGLSVPPELGGAGATAVEEAVLFEELGAALLGGPIFSTVALCVPLLSVAPNAQRLVSQAVSGDRSYALAWALDEPHAPLICDAQDGLAVDGVDENGEPLRITGTRTWVLSAGHADSLLVPVRTAAGTEVLSVDRADVELLPLPTMDATRPAWDVRFDGTKADRILSSEEAPAALTIMRRRASLLACAEAVGVSARLLAMTKAYATEREQFGRPIGSYQAVSHQVADMYVDLELGRSLLLWAALDDSDMSVTAAASRILPAAVASAERAIQLHGGIGMTWDSALHRYYKRALLLLALCGPPHALRDQVAKTLLDPERG